MGSGSEPSADGGRRRASLGLLLMLGASASFIAMVTCVKLLREGGMSTPEVMLWRAAPGLPIVLFELRRQRARIWPVRPGFVAMRVLFGSAAMGSYFWAVQSLSLFQNTVIQLTQPVFVALLAPILLREQLKGAAFWALPVALVGALVVTVGTDSLASPLTWIAAASVPLLPALVRLASSSFSAVAHMAIRLATVPTPRAPERAVDAPETVVFHFALWVSIGAAIVSLSQGRLTSLPSAMDTQSTVALIAGIAILGVAGQLMLSRAYTRTQAPAVAIVGYSAIPLSLVADVLVWNTPLTWSHAAGTLVMVVAGVLLARGSDRPADAPPKAAHPTGL